MEGVRDIEFVRAQYDAEVAYTDMCVAHVLNRLGELDLVDDALLIVHADHGEELDDHGCWFDHHGLYDTNVRVPLVLRLPGARRAGVLVRPMTSLLDLAPTVLDLLGLGDLAAGMSGTSRVPLIEGTATAGDSALYLTECTWMRKRGWRTPEWKLIEALEADIYRKPPVELYALRADPGERANLAESHREVVTGLQAARDAHVAARLAATGRPDPIVEQSEALRIWQ